VGVSNVWYRLNGGAWTNPVGSESWAATVTLSQSANLLQVYAEDAAGNHSPTSSIRFAYVQTDFLTLTTNGAGRIVGYVPGQPLDLGKAYSLRAIPDPDQLFAGWSGDLSSSDEALKFMMRSNLTLQANFAPNPFPALKGDYNGLFCETDPLGNVSASTGVTNSGCFKIALGARGGFSGKLLLEGKDVPFSGTFGLDLHAQTQVRQANGSSIFIDLQLDPYFVRIDGSVARDAQWTSTLLARRAATNTPFAGSYTLLVEGCNVEGACFSYARVPYGDSPAFVRVTRTGGIQMAGTLADGSPFSQSTTISEGGYWPIFAAPYGGKGVLIGWLSFPDIQSGAYVVWAKAPGVPGETYYTDGFKSPRASWLAAYTPPDPSSGSFSLTNGTIVLDSGDLPPQLSSQFRLENNRFVVTGGSISNLSLTLTPSTGQFQGWFTHPVSGRPTAIRGTLLQDSLFDGGGWFRGPSGASGNVRINPEL
jgi:hypothetical protein